MADVKKYLSLDKLTKYDAKIKGVISAGDEATLAAAKAHAEGLASNYDAAGSAATALAEAKTYADGKDAAIAVAKKAGDDAQADVDALELKVGTVADGKTVVGLIGEAKAAADAAQSDVDNLETYVGTIPADATAKDVVGYINEKTAGIASDTALAELQTQVNTNKGDIATIKGDYLKASDKTELQGNIDAVSGKVTTLIGSDANKSVRTIANEELAAQLIPEGAKESLDTLQEIAAWIQAHPDDASAMNKAIDDLKALVGTLPEGVTQTNVVAYVQALVEAEKSRAEGVESGLDSRLDAVETKLGAGAGSVTEQIVTAKQEAIDTAAQDATSKANAAQSAAEATAKGYTDTEVAKDRARLDALEDAKHTHANKALLDTYTQTEADLADAVAKKHEHANKTVLDGITAEKVTAWDKVSDKAEQTALQAEIERATAAEQALGARIDEFVEISEQEINDLFTA